MQIQQIQPQTFESKQRFLSEAQHSNLKTLLDRMNSEATPYCGEFIFKTKKLVSISINKKAKLIDKRVNTPPSNNIQGVSTLEIGKTCLTFDNETGEIIKYKKPFFKCWSNVMKKVGEILQLANDNFNNKKIVEKKFTYVFHFTTKTTELIENDRKKLINTIKNPESEGKGK